MLEVFPLILRIVVAYVYLLATVRLSGNRSVSQATPVDFVISVIIGDMVDDLLWAEVPASQFIVGVGTLVLVGVTILLVTSRSARAFLLLKGGFPVLIRDGALQYDTMRQEQLNDQDLEHLLRTKGIEPERVSEVHLATLEQDGHLSALKTRESHDAQERDTRAVRRRRQRKKA